MTAWLRGERSMPFGHNNQHVPVRLIDFDDLDQNQYVATQQFTYRAGSAERRADLMLLVNGLPLVLIEAKTPTRAAVSWVDGAVQVHDDYEKQATTTAGPGRAQDHHHHHFQVRRKSKFRSV